MPAGKYDLAIDKGFGWTFDTTWNDSDGNPIDLTDWTASMKIRPNYADQTTVTYYSLSTTTGEIVLGGTEGTIAMTLTDAQTDTIPPGNAVYDLRMTNPSGVSTKLLWGIVTVWDEVTDE